MMNKENMKGMSIQMTDWKRRLIAFAVALTLLISSCGLTVFAESSEEIYSDPVTAPIEAVEEIEGLVEEVAVVTPDPEEDAESDAEPEEDAGEAAETDEETEPETEAAGEPADLAVYEPGTLTAEIDGVGVTLEYTAEARIPEGALLTLYRVTGGEYFIDMKSTARVLREKQDGIWKREIGDEAVFYHIRLTDAEGTALSPDAGVKLTCTNLSVPAGSTGFVIGANTENIDWDGDLIVDFLPEAIGYVNLRMVQIGTITLVHTDRDYMVTASYGPDAGFPFGTALKVREIMPGTPEYNLYSGMTDEALNEDWSEITLERYFDISFVKDGEELEPQADVDVQITFRDKIEENEETEVQAVHIENNEAAVIESETDSQRAAKHDAEAIDTVTFTSDSFSVFGIVQKKKIVTKILDAQGRTYEIEVTYTQEAEIPEDAQVKVEEIPEGSDMWEAYRIQTAAALNADDVRLPGLYDISIVDAEGHKVDPRAAVNVAIKLLNDDNTSDDIQVVHFKEEIPQEFVEAAVQTQETAEQTEVRNEPLAEEDKIESEKIAAAVEGDTVTFNTDSFSVYAFAYTVDFHYEGVDWSIEGNSQILLSDLIPILNIRVGATEEDEGELLNVADVESVAFTDEHLVTVRQVSGLITYNGVENKDVGEKDFLLSSLEPFTSDEKLIVTLVDGTSIDNTIVIEVTDAQLVDITSLLDSAVITVNGNPVTGDNWNVVSGENYGIKLTFTEKPWFQFPDDNTPMVYKLPAAVQAQSLSGTFSLPISIYGKKYILPDNKYTVAADGTIAIQWNTGTTDEEKKIFGYLKSSDNARIDIDITGSIPSATGPIIFSSTVSKTVNVTEPHDVSISKTGTYNASTGNIDYTVTVNSKGDNSNIIVTDTINGTALTLIHDITASSDNVSTSYNGNSFTSTISSMSNGESITLCYSAHVDKTKIGKSGNATYDETNNSVKLTVTPDDNPSNNEDSTSIHDISFSNFTKEATSIGELTEENSQKYKIVSWEIVMNSNPTVPMAGSKIIDRNGTSWAMAYMDGITVTAYRADGTQAYEKTIAFGSDGLTKNNNDSWEYTIPSADTEPYKYVISYQTKVNVTNRGLDFAVSNYAEGKGGTSGGSYTVGGDGGTGNGGGGGNEQQEDPTWVDLKKTVTYSGIDKISWKIRLIVPAAGYPDGFKLVDYLPSYYFKKNNVNYYARDPLFNETNINSNFNITGLVPGETWNASFIGQSDNDWDKGREKGTFEIVFYKDGTNSGLASTGTDRLIEITYDTAIDEETQALREADYASTGNKEALVHYNETHAYVADVDKANSKAFATPRGQNIVKTFMENTVVGVNGVSRKAALFQIQLTGVQKDEVVIQDIFDTEIFEIAPAVNSYLHLYACGGDSYYSDENMYTRMYGNAVPTSTGANLIIPTPRSNSTGAYADYYYFKYFLLYKDDAEDIMFERAASNGGEAKTTNTANFETTSSSADITFTYEGLTKEQTSYDSVNNIGSYQITLNPSGIRLNGGRPLKMTDTMVNLSIIYASVKIETDPAERVSQISFDYKGNTGTFIIPDETKVIIKYDAKVLGNAGETVSYSNTAEMAGFTDGYDGEGTFTADFSGGATVYNVNIFKYKKDHMETGLNGAVFQIFDENKNPILNLSGNPITFTTAHSSLGGEEYGDKDGYVVVLLDRSRDGIALHKDTRYYLKEIQTPDNDTYAVDNTYYGFMISDNANYGQYIYHNNDTLKVYNTEKEGQLVVRKSFAGAANLTQKQKEAITFVVERTDVASNTEYYFKKEFTYADFADGEYRLESLPVGTYRVQETGAVIAGYTLTGTTVKVDNGSEISGTEAEGLSVTEDSVKQVEIKNTYTSNGAQITIVKVNSKNSSEHLFGAEFQILKKNGSDYAALSNGSLDANGKFVINYANKETGVTISGLEDGDYRIVETKAPNGYVALVDKIDFTVSGNSVSYAGDVAAVEYSSGTFTVKNEKEHSYTFTKVYSDGSTVISLPGATFGVFQATDDQEVTTARFTTGANGQGVLARKNDNLTDNILYYVKEITAPTGFALNETKYYFAYGAVNDVSVQYANLADDDATATVSDSSGTKQITVNKTWSDGQTEISSVRFRIKQTDSKGNENYYPDSTTTYEVTAGENWTKTVTGLPLVGAVGSEIVTYSYSVEELPITGYLSEVSQSGDTFTIANTPGQTVSIEVSKAWTDLSGAEDDWPSDIESITVQLMSSVDSQTPSPVEGKTLTLTASKPSDSFTGLPEKNESQKDIVYSVQEISVSGYNSVITGNSDEGFVITNTPINTDPSTTMIQVKKKWVDETGNELSDDAISGLTAEVQLVRYRTKKETTTLHFYVSGNKDNNPYWNEIASFVVPKDENLKIQLTADKADPNVRIWSDISGYIGKWNWAVSGNPSISNASLSWINNHTDLIGELNTVSYDDIYFVYLYNEDWEVTNCEVLSDGENGVNSSSDYELDTSFEDAIITLDASKNWKHLFSKLPISSGNYSYTYGIREVSCPDGYEFIDYSVADEVLEVNTEDDDADNASMPVPHGSTITVTNKSTDTELGKLTIRKSVKENTDVDKNTSGTFYFGIYTTATPTASDKPVKTASIELNNSSSGTVTVEGLICDTTYYVFELDGKNGAPITAGSAILNSTPYMVSYETTNDAMKGVKVDSLTGKETADITITNKEIPTTSVTVDKLWKQDDGKDITNSIQNAAIKVQLMKITNLGESNETRQIVTADINNTPFGTNGVVTLTGDLDTGTGMPIWSYTWNFLPKYDANDNEISYKVIETEAKVETNNRSGGVSVFVPDSENGKIKEAVKNDENGHFELTNILPTTEIQVSKAWEYEGEDWPSNIQSVTVGLYKGSDKNAIDTLTIDFGTELKDRTFASLPIYDDNGSKIVYSVEEEKVAIIDGTTDVPVTDNKITIGSGDDAVVWIVINSGLTEITDEEDNSDTAVKYAATITNSQNANKVFVEKRWYDAYGQFVSYAKEPVDVTLYKANGETVGSAKVTPGTTTEFLVDDVDAEYYVTETSSFGEEYVTRYATEQIENSRDETKQNLSDRYVGFVNPNEAKVSVGGTLYVMNTATRKEGQYAFEKKWIEFNDPNGQTYEWQLDGANTTTERAKCMKIEIQLIADIFKKNNDGTYTKVKEQEATDPFIIWDKSAKGYTDVPEHDDLFVVANKLISGGASFQMKWENTWLWKLSEQSGSGWASGATGFLPRTGYDTDGSLVYYDYRFIELRIFHVIDWNDSSKDINVRTEWWDYWEEKGSYANKNPNNGRTTITNRPKFRGNISIIKNWPIGEGGAQAVLVKLYRTKDSDIDTAQDVTGEISSNPSDYGLTANDLLEYGGTTYLKVTKSGNWKLTVNNVLTSVINEAGTSTSLARYFIDEAAYIDASGNVTLIPDTWTVTYGYNGTQGAEKRQWNNVDRYLGYARGSSKGDEAALTVSNTIPTGSINVTKQWYKADNSTAHESKNGDKIKFKVYYKVEGDDFTTYEYTDGSGYSNGYTIEYNGEKWEPVTLDNLPTTANITVDGNTVTKNVIGYLVEEQTEGMTVSAKYKLNEGTAQNASPVVTTGTITIVNTDTETDLTVVKVGKDGKPLSGAIFTLIEVSDAAGNTKEGAVERSSAETQTDGTVKFEGLTAGYYKLTETKAPAGYYATSEKLIVEVKMEDGQMKVEKVSGNVEGSVITYEPETRKATVVNTPGSELPATGGSGTLIYTIAGMTLIALAGVLLVIRRKRKA